MKYFIFLAAFLFSITAYAQGPLAVDPPILKLNSDVANGPEDETLTTQHAMKGMVKLTLGKLEFKAYFVYEDEPAPYQGYIVDIDNYIKIEKLVNLLSKGKQAIVDELTSQCKTSLENCRKDCDDRVNSLIKDKKDLKLKLDESLVSLEKAKHDGVLFSILTAAAGVGLGVLIFSVAN